MLGRDVNETSAVSSYLLQGLVYSLQISVSTESQTSSWTHSASQTVESEPETVWCSPDKTFLLCPLWGSIRFIIEAELIDWSCSLLISSQCHYSWFTALQTRSRTDSSLFHVFSAAQLFSETEHSMPCGLHEHSRSTNLWKRSASAWAAVWLTAAVCFPSASWLRNALAIAVHIASRNTLLSAHVTRRLSSLRLSDSVLLVNRQ